MLIWDEMECVHTKECLFVCVCVCVCGGVFPKASHFRPLPCHRLQRLITSLIQLNWVPKEMTTLFQCFMKEKLPAWIKLCKKCDWVMYFFLVTFGICLIGKQVYKKKSKYCKKYKKLYLRSNVMVLEVLYIIIINTSQCRARYRYRFL